MNQREALLQCFVQGNRRSLLQDIWRSYDLGTIRDAVRLLHVPEPYKSKFDAALKQMSG